MSITRVFTIDTNFFIAGFGETPKEYEILNKIFRKMKIAIYVPDYVRNEMRWYMRRSIEPLIVVKKVDPKKLAKFEKVAAAQVDMKLPQTPDMAVAYLANKENIPVVSSDLRLVELSHQIGIEAMMNSAFLIMLIGEIKDSVDKEFLQKLYETLFSDEISYSVQ